MYTNGYGCIPIKLYLQKQWAAVYAPLLRTILLEIAGIVILCPLKKVGFRQRGNWQLKATVCFYIHRKTID